MWQVRRVPEAPIGHVLSRSEYGVMVFHSYARGRDTAGGRRWLCRANTSNSAVVLMVQHEAELFTLLKTLAPEPDEWPV